MPTHEFSNWMIYAASGEWIAYRKVTVPDSSEMSNVRRGATRDELYKNLEEEERIESRIKLRRVV